MSAWIRTAILGVAVLVAALVGAGIWIWSAAPQSNVGKLNFENALQIPPPAEPSIDEPGRKVFDLELQEGSAELLPGKRTETWGVNGPRDDGPVRRGAG